MQRRRPCFFWGGESSQDPCDDAADFRRSVEPAPTAAALDAFRVVMESAIGVVMHGVAVRSQSLFPWAQ